MTGDPHHVEASEAQTRWAELLDRVQRGEQWVIAREGRLIARLSPTEREEVPEAGRPRIFGHLAGRVHIAEDFDAPDPRIEATFYGDSD